MSVLRQVAPLLLFLVTIEGLAQLAFSQDSVVDSLQGSRTGRRMASLRRARIALDGGHDTLHAVAAGTLTEDAALGWRARPGRFETAVSVQTVGPNGRRVTAPEGWSPSEPRRTLAVLGDSFSFGDEVDDDEAWPWLLRDRADVVVQNLGVLGYGLDQMVLRWEKAPEPVDVVVVGLTAVSELRTGLTWDAWAKPSFSLASTGLTLHGSPVPGAEALLQSQWRLATPWVVALWYERLMQAPVDWTTLAPLNHALRDRLVTSIRRSGATPVVVWMAAQGEFDDRPADSNRLWRAWCDGADVICIDTTTTLRALHQRGTRVIRTAHWTPEANAAVAGLLADELRKRELLP